MLIVPPIGSLVYIRGIDDNPLEHHAKVIQVSEEDFLVWHIDMSYVETGNIKYTYSPSVSPKYVTRLRNWSPAVAARAIKEFKELVGTEIKPHYVFSIPDYCDLIKVVK